MELEVWHDLNVQVELEIGDHLEEVLACTVAFQLRLKIGIIPTIFFFKGPTH